MYVNKAAWVSGCLKDFICRLYGPREKVRIGKTVIKPIFKYVAGFMAKLCENSCWMKMIKKRT